MKFILNICILIFILSCNISDDTQPVPNVQTGKMTKELIVNGNTREYIIYIPESYTGTSSLPLLLSFHGLTGNMEFNFNHTNFNELAESENY